MKKFKVAIIGCGNRGFTFAQLLDAKKDKFEFAALCDTAQGQIDKIHNLTGIKDTDDFTEPEEFFKEKRADLLIIATPDRDHVPMSVKALELGYDLFLEKPISDSREELKLLLETQKKTGGQIIVCHELRYGGGYRKVRELIDSGTIGKLRVIDASERPFYWHWAQAYVRGYMAYLETCHPVILAKCSHDLDLLYYYAGSECDTVSSVGDLQFFIPENAPDGAADRCLECKYVNECVYSAKKIYVDMWHEMGEPEFRWPFYKVSIDGPHTEEKLMKALETTEYARCVFKCNTEQVDHQMVQMTFKNGVKASLKMIYSPNSGRRMTFYGTMGEIVLEDRDDEIKVMPFGKEEYTIKIGSLVDNSQGHGGGDEIIMDELYEMLSKKGSSSTDISASIEAHLMGIAAEESRKQGGNIIKVHK